MTVANYTSDQAPIEEFFREIKGKIRNNPNFNGSNYLNILEE